ncbi:MAG: hypothetical protein HWE11_14530 [Gammaproteobacteria bacterium]|nr:hypothetical protein [Gammaproteobacteria bacterium]
MRISNLIQVISVAGTLLAGSTLLVACASNNEAETAAATPAPVATVPVQNCSAPPPVRDIWALEPMLTNSGDIKPEMTREEKKAVILEYIRAKNETYSKCKKGKN